jgi:hypothetical protein
LGGDNASGSAMRRTQIHSKLAITIASCCFAGLPRPASAQGRVFWEEGGAVVCSSSWYGGVQAFAVVPAAAGGMIAAWADARGDHESVWAQRLDHSGRAVWPENGVELRAGTWSPGYFGAVSDGQGGMIAEWYDHLAGPYAVQITAQRVDSAGSVLWGSSGTVVVGSNANREYAAAIARDGRGGAIVAWEMEFYSVPDQDTLAIQRLDSLGRPRWGPSGVVVHVDSFLNRAPHLCTDARNGCFVAWTAGCDLVRAAWVQRVDSSGRPVWAAPGVRPMTDSSYQLVEDAVSCSGGCIVAWKTGWLGSAGIRAQHMTGDGSRLWGDSGVSVYDGPGKVWVVRGVVGDSNSSFWLWVEERSGSLSIYAQRLDINGNRLWQSTGVPVGTLNSTEPQGFAVSSDTRGGVLASWPRYQSGNWDILGQHFDSDGHQLWGDTGLVIVRDENDQAWAPVSVVDGEGGAIVIWGEFLAGQPRAGLRAQRIGDAGAVVERSPSIRHPGLFKVWPSPALGAVCISVSAAGSLPQALVIADAAGRVVRELAPAGIEAGRLEYTWDRRSGDGIAQPDGLYFCRFKEGLPPIGKLVLASH